MATLPLLIREPGALTRRYVDGERAKFVSPMALFLFSVFLLFASISRLELPDVAGTAQGLVAAKQQLLDRQERAEDRLKELRERRREADASKVVKLDAEIARTTREIAALRRAAAEVPSNPSAASGSQPARMGATSIDTGLPYLNRQIRHVQHNPELYAYKLKSASYKFSWALIPVSLPFIWGMFFWRRDVGLYDHAIFAIYSLSFMTLLAVGLIGLAIIGVGASWLWLAMLIVPPIHMFKHLRGTYRISCIGASWRTAVLLVSVTIAGGLFFAVLVWMEAE